MTTPAPAALLAGALAHGAVAPAVAQSPVQPTARVSGTVVDETGEVMRGVFVRLVPDGGSEPLVEASPGQGRP